MLKYSKQRESIKNFLVTRYDHPTAETVYLNIRKEFPNISLGTVYRNLNLLAEIGEILPVKHLKNAHPDLKIAKKILTKAFLQFKISNSYYY